jgi:hypothetical protein
MKRYKKYSASPSGDDEISDETSTTRLFAYDLAEVKAMCVDGKKKSDVIRELVRRALYSRRYRQASTDPAFKEILKSFDDSVGVRLHHLEERLANRMEADHRMTETVLGYLYFTALFGLDEMREIRLQGTPAEVSEEEFLAAWQERFQAVRGRGYRNMRAQAEKRRRRIETGSDAGDGDVGPDGEG